MAAIYSLGKLVGSAVQGYRDATRGKPAPPAKPELGNERGFSGLKVFAGLIDEEYQATLDDLQDRIAAYEKMRPDGDVKALEDAIMLPLLGAQYECVPHEDAKDEKLAQEQADALNTCIEQLETPWSSVLCNAYRAVFYGFAFAEKVWTERDGLYCWQKLSPRKPDTVSEWRFAEDGSGTLTSIVQEGYRVSGNTARYEYTEPIPLDKLMLWSYRDEYGNPEGRGLFRDVYRHWYIKDKAYTAACIRIERLACPTPMATPVALADGTYSDPGQDAIDAFGEALGRLRVYEQGRIILPAGYTVSAFELGDPSVPWLDFIVHHGGMILRAGLAQFLALGQDGNTGAYALAEDSSSFFLMALAAHAQWFCDSTTRQGVRQFVDVNWGRPKDGLYPHLQYSGLGVKDKKALAEVLRVLAGPAENLLERRDEIANAMREAMGYELIPEDEIEAEKERKEEQRDLGLQGERAAVEQAANPAPVVPVASQKPPAARGKQPPAKSVAAAEDEASCDCGDPEHGAVVRMADPQFEGALNEAEAAFQEQGGAIVRGMVDQYVRKLGPLAEAGDYVRMAELTVPLQGKYESWLRGYLGRVVDMGRERLARTTGHEPGPKSRKLTNWVAAKARLLSEGHAANLRWVVCHTLMDELRAGRQVAQVLGDAKTIMAGELNDRLDADLNEAASEAVEALQE
jgi:hypothetical protein